MSTTSDKILVGKKEIFTYLKISEGLLDRFMKNGKLPVVVMEGRYYAHADNLDRYFQLFTANGSGTAQGEVEGV